MNRNPAIAGVLLAAALLCGCTAKMQKGLPPGMQGVQTHQELVPLVQKLEAEGERNWVLNLDSLAVAAMRTGDRDTAKRALDEAILQIEVVYGDSDQARQARSLWFTEGSKIFKGDPYERSMTYFYRGTLYMQDGEWDNARACFRSALVQDSFAEEEQYDSDWTIFHWLIGVCEVRLGRPQFAEEHFQRARKAHADLRQRYDALADRGDVVNGGRKSVLAFDSELPAVDEFTNLLVLTQQGRAPRKVAAGSYGQMLAYAPGGGGSARPVRISLDGGKAERPVLADSVYYQASTRGGREIDALLGRKAVVRGVTEDAGNVALLGGGVVAAHGASQHNHGAAFAGVGIMVAGAALYGLSTLVQPAADTRSWRSLPDTVAVAAFEVAPGPHALDVAYDAEVRGALPGSAKTWTIDVPAPGEGLAVALVFPPPDVRAVLPPPQHSNTIARGGIQP